jgi:hypothetical protein
VTVGAVVAIPAFAAGGPDGAGNAPGAGNGPGAGSSLMVQDRQRDGSCLTGVVDPKWRAE